VNGRCYDVLISTCDEDSGAQARLILRYGDQLCSFDLENSIRVTPCRRDTAFLFAGSRVPLYTKVSAFPSGSFSLPIEGGGPASVAYVARTRGQLTVRLGYNLFDEIRYLLTTGQPPANAATPTLELHVALLRELIVGSGIPLVEIPPVPCGYELIACLTHDIDHPVLRNHWMDHTMFGFLFRATVGASVDFCRGRTLLKDLARNWLAVGRLPLVHLGLAKDFWRGFDRYLQIEAGLGATYFAITRKGYAGREANGKAPARRAARYELADIMPELARIRAGAEIALHGIDAWIDSDSGRAEQGTLSATLGTGCSGAGVRMHWLMFDENSPAVLERAGFSYDSSVGYNETVGFRAGTAQGYQPPGAAKLIEIPLVIMDTAMFYPQFLNLNNKKAWETVEDILEEVVRFGGVLTINWHDRSIAPERLWEDFYLDLLKELKVRRTWFPTAAQAAAWFRKRRSVTFGAGGWDEGQVRFSVSAYPDESLPGMRVRVHHPRPAHLSGPTPQKPTAFHVDLDFAVCLETSVAIPVGQNEL